jgi:hypothetical protein
MTSVALPLPWGFPDRIKLGILGIILMFAYTATSNIFQAEVTESLIYVDIVNGSDSTGDGSAGNPYQHAEYGFEQATPGDTVCLKSGTYTDQDNNNSIIRMESTEGGTSGNPITITACPGQDF